MSRLDYTMDDERAQVYVGMLEQQRPQLTEREWLVYVVVGEQPDGQDLLAEYAFTARSLSDREAMMESRGIDRENHRWAAGHLDDNGRPIEPIGSDPVLRARLRLDLQKALQR